MRMGFLFLGLNSRFDWNLDAGVFSCCIAEMGTVYRSKREQRVGCGQASVQILDRCTVTEMVHS